MICNTFFSIRLLFTSGDRPEVTGLKYGIYIHKPCKDHLLVLCSCISKRSGPMVGMGSKVRRQTGGRGRVVDGVSISKFHRLVWIAVDKAKRIHTSDTITMQSYSWSFIF